MRTLLILAVAASACAAPTLKPKRPDDAVAIHGTWQEESRSRNGEPVVAATDPLMVRFTAMGTAAYAYGKLEGRGSAVNYVLKPGTSPSRLMWGGSGESTVLYRLDGDRLTLAFVGSGQAVPDALEPHAHLSIYHMRRVKE